MEKASTYTTMEIFIKAGGKRIFVMGRVLWDMEITVLMKDSGKMANDREEAFLFLVTDTAMKANGIRINSMVEGL